MVASVTASRYGPVVRFLQPVTLTSPPTWCWCAATLASKSALRKTEVATTLDSSTQRRDVSRCSREQLLECHSRVICQRCHEERAYRSSLRSPEIESFDQLREETISIGDRKGGNRIASRKLYRMD